MAKKQMDSDEVANSAERQLKDLEKAKTDKINGLQEKRINIVNNSRTVQAIMYAVANTYREVFPGAEGFIELRIKSPDSIETKARNDFTEILNEKTDGVQREEDQKEIIRKITSKPLKDILAFTVITTEPPKKFRTGDDDLNKKLTDSVEELKETKERLKVHKRFMDKNKNKINTLSHEIDELKLDISKADSEEEMNELIDNLTQKIYNSKDSKETEKLRNELKFRLLHPSKESLSKKLEEKTNQSRLIVDYIEYGEKNFERTEETYFKTLRDLQYEMSQYFISNLEKFSTFKFWGANRTEVPKLIQKPGFRSAKATYSVVFSNEKNRCKIDFEAQGKGELDYIDAEFKALGAIYHEEQKTKDGLISKKTDMPDFTIIGSDRTKKIEDEVRRKYEELVTIEDLNENLSIGLLEEVYNELKKYEEKISQDATEKYLSKRELKRKMNDAFNIVKEHLIQDEIEDRINEKLNDFADSEFVKNRIQQSEELTRLYEEEKQKLKTSNKEGSDLTEIDHNARVRVMYRAKEKEILEYSQNVIPLFSRANIPSDSKEIIVYNFTVGESLYRYFYNKLNGLKDENGKYKFEPQEQQKRALLKLKGLFEEEYSNFYTYNRETKSFEGIENPKIQEDSEK